ncbi:MAG: bifunctional UDP-N-acetylglucosamine diphosphorylase/glucosamine-1-phosphate N-acetyltransferase GlmU [Dactylosporangium sp.]|nr:bifunctional UDP-N-acetylglucosamine diphosphorylase/glucosamine-1-phosphate N-acetyltransferase GlmU [Dactylosporangium sp.]NNJ60276.1 bifunctional UDP-N-acetylglucosamine diphosphorylase/glucosamine-1-phosphate N-acetyltransferase GlmU [Dactylosporangium sp.]
MRSSLPKVLHSLLGRTMLGHVLAVVDQALPGARTVVVVGKGADQVSDHVAAVAPAASTVLQAEQLGTGHAVRIALAELPEVAGNVIVLNGDIPLLREATLRSLVAEHDRAGRAGTLLTAEVPDPRGLGRVLRAEDGRVTGIVEERDATPEQRDIREINAGAYVFDAQALRGTLSRISTDNDQGEEYLTDVFSQLIAEGRPVAAHQAGDLTETLGANDRAELAGLRALLRDRVNQAWMCSGVSIIDPATTWIDVTVGLEPDVLVEPNTHLRGTTTVAEGAVVGPDTTVLDGRIGAGAVVVRAHIVNAVVGQRAQVGPFAYLRPGTRLAARAKIGTFVEAKGAEVGEGAKVPHLTYVGDATIGEGTNIGAATVFVNYDGVHKHRTTVGAHARTGADNMFVAPVSIGDGAYTAAGSVITDDVPPGAMAVARGRQRNVEGWVERRRAGTASAEAAKRALTAGDGGGSEARGAGPGVEGASGSGDDGCGPAEVRTEGGPQ